VSTVGLKSWEIGYRSGTTNYEIREDSVTRLVIANGGNVGIGTGSPLTILDARGIVRVSTTDQSTNRYRLFNQTSGNTWDIVGGLNGANNTDFSIYDGSQTRFIIKPTTGNVLIGSTTDPGAKLYVNGVSFINTTSSAGDYYLQVGGGIYATNNSVNLSIATQNNRFIAGEYGIGVGTGTFDASQTNGINVRSGTAPTTNVADVFVMYAADITAGNAAPHFRTENGNTVKIYQETTGVGSATFASPGAGSTVKTDDTRVNL
jgi:hypothetical protein